MIWIRINQGISIIRNFFQRQYRQKSIEINKKFGDYSKYLIKMIKGL